MKHLISFLLALAVCISGLAQDKVSRVVMKNGATVTGRIVEFNPVSHIVLNVAGFDTRIEMSDIDLIEEAKTDEPVTDTVTDTEGFKVIDTAPYEETVNIQVGPFSIEMVLVRGAIFDMGYDGRGSRLLFSEPVHSVQLSSFYVNKRPISKEIVDFVIEGKETKNDKSYNPRSWNNAKQTVDALASKTNLPLQLISEAQCEFVAVTEDIVDRLEIKKNEVVYCYDYFSEYKKTKTPQLDPLGPENGSNHVIRYLDAEDEKIYNRIEKTASNLHVNSLRITLPASSM